MFKLSQKQAQLIVDAHDIETLMDNEEENELLFECNRGLHEAYHVLIKIANGF